MRILPLILLGLIAATASAQESFYPAAPNTDFCARGKTTVDDVGPNRYGPRNPGSDVEWVRVGGPDFPVNGVPYFIPFADRTTAGEFTVLDASGARTAMASLKGKVVVIGLWSTTCEPSAIQLLELSDLQKKGDTFGFQVFPVNYDRRGWTQILPYLTRVKDRLPSPKVFIPGVGKEGVALLHSAVPALPALFILDRQGRVAARYSGYRAGALVQALKIVLGEPQQESPSTPPPPPPQ